MKKLYSMSGFILLLSIFIITSLSKKNECATATKEKDHLRHAKFGMHMAPEFKHSSVEAERDILFRSADGGETWENLSAGLPPEVNISQIYARENEMFAATYNGVLYHCLDLEKGLWVKENPGGFFKNESITGIYGGQSGPYVSIAGHGIFKRIAGTGFWQPIGGDELKNFQVHDLLETAEEVIYIASGGGIHRSNDEGKTWAHVFTTGWVTSLKAHDGKIIAAAMQGILQSSDGFNWLCILADEGAIYKTGVTNKQFAAVKLAAAYASSSERANWPGTTGDTRLRITDNEGKSWQLMGGKGLDNARQILDFESAGPYLFISHNAGISRSADGGKTWQLVRTNKDSNGMSRIELSSAENVLYALKGKGGC